MSEPAPEYVRMIIARIAELERQLANLQAQVKLLMDRVQP